MASASEHGVISAALATNNTLRAALSGSEFVVTAFGIVAAGAVGVTFKAGSTAVSGLMSLAANGGIATPHNPEGHFVIPDNTAFVMALDAAVQVSGWYTGYTRPLYS